MKGHRRYRKIATVLARHGLGYLVDALGLDRFVPFHRGLLGHPRRETPYTRPEHVRMALEELGAVATKLGQILSTRPDLLPPEYLAELARLQDAAPSGPFEDIRAVIETELGRPLEEAYERFEPIPLAAASIGQAHAARLPGGEEVVVKVRRPGIVEQVREDLEILRNLAASASRRWEAASRYDLEALAEEFSDTLLGELDYLREARNAERFAANFADDPAVHVPRVFRERTTSRVLSLERVGGIKVSDAAALERAGIDRAELAERAARMLLEMVFEHGFFHADPHPGNFFVEPGGRIALLDFGMVGTVDARTRDELADLLVSLARRDTEALADAIVRTGAVRPGVDTRALVDDLDLFLEEYYGRPLREIAVGPLIERTLATVREHRLQLPSRLALLLKTIIMSEGLGARLDPDFRLTDLLVPYARRLVLRRHSPALLARRVGRGAGEAARLAEELPGELRRLMRALDRQGLSVDLRPGGLEGLARRIDAAGERISLSVLLAGLLVGLVLFVGPSLPDGGRSGLAVGAGVAAAVLVALLLARSLRRDRRR